MSATNEAVVRAELLCPNGHRYTVPMWGECPQCQGYRNARTSEILGDAVRNLKAAMECGNERESYHLVKQLAELGHPDVKALVTSIRERLSKPAGRGSSKPRASRDDA